MVWEMRESKLLRRWKKNNDASRNIVFFEQFDVGSFLIFNYPNFVVQTFPEIDHMKNFPAWDYLQCQKQRLEGQNEAVELLQYHGQEYLELLRCAATHSSVSSEGCIWPCDPAFLSFPDPALEVPCWASSICGRAWAGLSACSRCVAPIPLEMPSMTEGIGAVWVSHQPWSSCKTSVLCCVVKSTPGVSLVHLLSRLRGRCV